MKNSSAACTTQLGRPDRTAGLPNPSARCQHEGRITKRSADYLTLTTRRHNTRVRSNPDINHSRLPAFATVLAVLVRDNLRTREK